MKNKKWLVVIFIILAVALIIGGVAFAFSAVDNSDTDSNKKEEKLDSTTVGVVDVVIMDGKYNDADYVCMKETITSETVKFYDVVYVYLKDSNVKKTNLVNLMVCADKEIFDDQKANDDKVFERYYNEDTLAISYEYADEQIYIASDGFVQVEKTGNDLKSELEGQGYVCE